MTTVASELSSPTSAASSPPTGRRPATRKRRLRTGEQHCGAVAGFRATRPSWEAVAGPAGPDPTHDPAAVLGRARPGPGWAVPGWARVVVGCVEPGWVGFATQARLHRAAAGCAGLGCAGPGALGRGALRAGPGCTARWAGVHRAGLGCAGTRSPDALRRAGVRRRDALRPCQGALDWAATDVLRRDALRRAGLHRAGLGCAGPGWAAPGRAGLRRAGLHRIGLGCAGPGSSWLRQAVGQGIVGGGAELVSNLAGFAVSAFGGSGGGYRVGEGA
jgi:hypothetical protein